MVHCFVLVSCLNSLWSVFVFFGHFGPALYRVDQVAGCLCPTPFQICFVRVRYLHRENENELTSELVHFGNPKTLNAKETGWEGTVNRGDACPPYPFREGRASPGASWQTRNPKHKYSISINPAEDFGR